MSDPRKDTWVDSLLDSVNPGQGSIELSQPSWTSALPRAGGYTEATLPEASLDGGTFAPFAAEPSASLLTPRWEPLPGLPERYEDLGPLGEGGMGEVRRVRDRELNRTMALKVIRAGVRTNAETLARFVEEAQVTAQLQHPGIVPVHELGRLDDERLYFTMQEVRGRTLREVIQEVHANAQVAGSRPSASGWTFRRLIDVFRRVCETVAYAHARGVVHRDLKPQNVMVGEYGAVLVLDWGLAKVLGRASIHPDDAIETARTSNDSYATRQGRVSGTPAYMPPEQAQGMRDLLGPTADVWSLGAVLFEILAGRAPFHGVDAHQVMFKVVRGEREPLEGALPIPAALDAIVSRAMSAVPEARYPDAEAMGQAVADWLEGARRQEQALAVVAEADEILPRVAELQAEAEVLRAEARKLLDPLPPHAPAAQKKPGWRMEDQAAELENQARLVELTYVRTLYNALNLAPELPEAHDRLADHYFARHREAEEDQDEAAAARQELQLRAHDRGRYASYLDGQGALTLLTDPPGAEVRLHRYTLQDRRLEPVFLRALGETPLRALSLPKGSYLLTLHAPGHAEVRYPVLIERGGHWDGVAPGDTEPTPIRLPKEGELAEDDCYVPAGWFISGGDPEAADGLPRRRIWVDAFVVKRFPVTCGEYLAFLNDLVLRGHEEEAISHAPSEDVQTAEQKRLQAIVGRNKQGLFFFRGDGDAEPWESDWPISLVRHASASTFAEMVAHRDAQDWRLPHDQEWEKAARGADGRLLPWGEFLDPTWACVAGSHAGAPRRHAVTNYALDQSPYGVRGMVGGVRDWCLNGYVRTWPQGTNALDLETMRYLDSDFRMVRGGAWASAAQYCRPVCRFANKRRYRSQLIGFRLARSIR
ncbi:MAG: SUMF1/EgtB/PvdO family nonheme iron enzyme [Alphaproteobacteria bacterium]|nr:SUMF1/EgtB/PvdO family nonheme iron enzyme [Alphaproteobacteria bacterium]